MTLPEVNVTTSTSVNQKILNILGIYWNLLFIIKSCAYLSDGSDWIQTSEYRIQFCGSVAFIVKAQNTWSFFDLEWSFSISVNFLGLYWVTGCHCWVWAGCKGTPRQWAVVTLISLIVASGLTGLPPLWHVPDPRKGSDDDMAMTSLKVCPDLNSVRRHICNRTVSIIVTG